MQTLHFHFHLYLLLIFTVYSGPWLMPLAMATADSQGAAVSTKVAAETGALPVLSEFLEDMKRRNAAESDHRNIMTPEFREFCIVTREHIVCWAVFLVLFAGSYALVARVCTRREDPLTAKSEAQRQNQHQQPQTTRRRFLVTPYASTFRARQMALVVAASGLASALMTAALLVVTVALANAMEHGDPRLAPSWRLWLLPATLLSPADAHTSAFASGPRAAHDFPPVLRRLWRYQSVISIGTAVVAVPLSVLFEATPRRDPSLRRLKVAALRWVLAAALLLGIRRAVAGSGMSQNATVRYSVHYAASVCVALPAVLGLVPRGTWALFAWLRACVGQRHERARAAQARYRRLRLELSRIELRLEQAIGSWKGGQSASDRDLWISDSPSATNSSANSSDSESELTRSRSVAELPPAHPGLPRNTNFAQAQHARHTISGRSRRLTASKPKTSSLPLSPMALGSPPPSPHLHDSKRLSSYRPIYSVSLATSPADRSGIFDVDFTVLDSKRPAEKGLVDRQRQREREREREVERLSRQIKKYHAQLLFVRAEMARTEKSGLLGISSEINSKRPFYIRIIGSLSAAVLVAATALCWLLVVVQVGRGALSAIFVGEPDLTHNLTYFLPALAEAQEEGPLLYGSAVPSSKLAPAALVPHALATCCQLLSAALLFVVVMFGLLSMGTSVEDSVHPLRFLATSYAGRLLRARQWECLPYVFLHQSTLAAILPIHATSASASASASIAPTVSQIAGNTSRVFFSSSTDLTSFYRQLQRQAASSSSSQNTLLPGGILPEGFFQARIWGRRVFMLFDSQSRPVSPIRLLTYVWIVCGLAMTWPSVLRTAGLISERAYVLPIASLVEPLWSTMPLHDTAAFALEEEELVLLPATVAAHRYRPTREVDPVDEIKLASNATLLSEALPSAYQGHNKQKKQYLSEDLLLRPAITASMCVVPTLSLVDFSLISEQSNLITEARFDDNESVSINSQQLPQHKDRDPLSTDSVQQAVTNHPASATLERRISRRTLHQTLAVDTLPRILIRGTLALSSKISSHVHISVGYFVWWLFPDLIVPISPVTIDMQLGYRPQVPVTLLPVNGFTSLPGHSEWYGMLRRMQLQKLWLPQADDGTPLVLQPVSHLAYTNSTMNSESSNELKSRLQDLGSRAKSNLKQKISFFFDSSMHGVHTIALRVCSRISVLFWRLCQIFVQGASVVVDDAMALYVQDTFAGRVLASIAQGIDYGMQKSSYAASIVWEEAFVPFWQQLSLAATGLSSSISFIVSRAVPLVISLAGSSSRSGAQQSSRVATFAVADAGVFTVVPSVFLAEFWDAAISQGSPAFQRLRPELWPHLFANGNVAVETAFNNGQIGALNDHDVILQPLSASSLSGEPSGAVADGDVCVSAEAGAGAGTGAGADAQAQAQAQGGFAVFSSGQAMSEEGSDRSSYSSLAQQPHASDENAGVKHEGQETNVNVRSARKVWSTLDWMLAVYRVLLGILACRSVFGPSRSSRVFSF